MGKKRHPNRVVENVLKKQSPESRRVAEILRMMIKIKEKRAFLQKNLKNAEMGQGKSLKAGF